MSSVYERLTRLMQTERHATVPPSFEVIQQRNSVMDSITEKEREGERLRGLAQDFLRASGIKLIFMEMNNDLLKGKGEILQGGRTEYCAYGKRPKLWYEADLRLTWSKGLLVPTDYVLMASIQGDLLDEGAIGTKRLHRKSLDLDLMEKNSSEGFNATFNNDFFDIENPTGEDLTTIRKWTEANIVNFVRQKERLKGKSIF